MYGLFYFFADWLVDIPDASSTNRVRQTMIQKTRFIQDQVQTDVAHFLQQNFELELGFKR